MNILNWLASLFRQVPHNSFPKDNQGVLDGKRPEDYVAGTIPYEVRNASGDWRNYCPDGEKQSYTSFDSMGCVSFSHTNSLEIQAKKLTGVSYNWSDRFLAKLSGTTRNGNYLWKVADTVRQYGLVNEEIWPSSDSYNWDSYYADIPPDIIAKGKADFPFSILYEWIPVDKGSLLYHLKHAPIQITIPNTNPVHAVVLVAIVGDTYFYFDSYPPYLKTMSTPPNSALKIVLQDNRIIMRKVGWQDSEKGVYVGFDSMDRQAKFYASMQILFPDYRVEEREWNLGKRPWS